MQKRPLSLTIIAVFLALFAVLGLYGALTMGSNPVAAKMLEHSPVPLEFLQAWSVLGCAITLACAYGIWKGLPWSRVLYVAWSAIGIVVSFYTSPIQSLILVSIVIVVVVSAFLFSNRANEWFSARGLALKRENA